MLLDKIDHRRRKKKREDIFSVRKGVLKYPFCLTAAIPKNPVVIPDKIFLMEMGLSEPESEILLTLWEAGGKLAIWGDGSEPDLCHELGLTSSTIRGHVKQLVELGIVKKWRKGRIDYLVAIRPYKLKELFSKTITTRVKAIDKYLVFREKELEQIRKRIKKKGISSIDFHPKAFLLDDKAHGSIKKLAEEEKIVCGFVIGSYNFDDNLVEIEDFVPIETKCGPIIHFNPVWKSYHMTKKRLLSLDKKIIGEFHTHPDGNTDLVEKDKQKQSRLRRGLWFVITADDIVGYVFSRKKNRLITELIRLKA